MTSQPYVDVSVVRYSVCYRGSMLQCVAVCCSMPCVAKGGKFRGLQNYKKRSVLQCIAVYCSVLQCVEMRLYSVTQAWHTFVALQMHIELKKTISTALLIFFP